jgi:hypothetical protein
MNDSPRSSDAVEFVSFNGLRVEKSTVPLLVQSLVECDPMTIPSGEDLEPQRRETVSRLFRCSFQDAGTEPSLLQTLGSDLKALRYLTGLMASRY